MTNPEIIDDIMRRDTDPPMTKKGYRKWLASLTSSEIAEYYDLVKQEYPSKRQTLKIN